MSFFDFQNIADFPENWTKIVVVIGNFDGVHAGHRVVLQAAIDEAKRRGVPAVALTFEPHPRSFFTPEKPVFRLTPPKLKAQIFETLGLDGSFVMQFDAQLAQMEAEVFVNEVLLSQLKACHVVMGYDFHFGKARAGSPEFLLANGRKKDFGVTVVPAHIIEGAQSASRAGQEGVVSSTSAREALREGRVEDANQLLGYHYQFSSEIVKGAQLGRKLGYPTANMLLPDQNNLKYGVYAVRFARASGETFDGVASFGERPTVNSGDPVFETHLFDFDDDLYGENCTVSLCSFLRPEQNFDSLDLLVEQMDKDSEKAKAILKNFAPLSELEKLLLRQ